MKQVKHIKFKSQLLRLATSVKSTASTLILGSIIVERNVPEIHAMLTSIKRKHRCYASLKPKERKPSSYSLLCRTSPSRMYRSMKVLLDVNLP